jgi:ubiquitin-protein ligase
LSESQRREKTILNHYKKAIEECKGMVRVVDDDNGTVTKKTSVELAMDTPVLFCLASDDNLNKLYFLMLGALGPSDAFKEGEYLGYLTLVKDYPFVPPDFTFMTPNGVYQANAGTPCISTGKFHHSDRSGVHGYAASTGFTGFAMDIWGTFMDPQSLGHGINLLQFDESACAALAKESRAFNDKKHGDIMAKIYALFPDIDARRKHWREKHEAVRKAEEAYQKSAAKKPSA